MTSGVLSQVSCDKRPASICGGVMIRLDVSYFYRASLALDAFPNVPELVLTAPEDEGALAPESGQ